MKQKLFSQAARMISTKNTLGSESSPYLLQHRLNPVHWYSWGEEAFRIARQLDRPIFLSIGYSTCHWCHVMERESFEDQETAKLLNEHFVSVKVDREERPDIDRTYMTYVQAITGSGGWPLSIFIDSDGKPFLGGTYFPPQPMHGRPSFKQLLSVVSNTWKERREHVGETADLSMQMLKQVSTMQEHSVHQLSLDHAVDAYKQAIDPIHGGLGPARGPKFPCAPSLLFLQRSGELQPLVQLTLNEMAKGGIHDQLEGGFHRYSVDGRWLVPHFEKMLYDQAQLLMLYSQHPTFNWVTHGIIDYVTKHLAHPAGAFYAAEDADSLVDSGEKHEGAWCVWKKSEMQKILSSHFTKDQIEHFMQAYGVTENGNFEHEKNILHLTTDYDPSIEAIRQVLLQERQKRPRPARDEKVIAAWNGLWLKAISQAAILHQSTEWLQQGKRLAHFIRDQMIQNDKLLRCWYPDQKGKIIDGFAEDYAAVIAGLLQLSQSVLRMEKDSTGSAEYLNFARQLQSTMDHLFYREGAYVTGEHLAEFKDDYDGAEPSANGMAFLNQVRWRQLGSMPDHANEMLSWYQSKMAKQPLSCPMAWLAWFENDRGITVTIPSVDWIPGNLRDPDILFVIADGEAHICQGSTCGPPHSNPAELHAALK